MKLNISLCVLLSFIPAAASGQQASESRSDSTFRWTHDSGGSDPFDALDSYMKHRETHRPSPNTQSWANEGENTASVSFQQLLHKAPKEAIKEHKKGNSAFSKGENKAAMGYLQSALQIDPGFSDAHNDLGVVLTSLGNLDEAVEEFQKAIDLAPDHNRALANLSVALYGLKRYKEVCQTARRALRIDPRHLGVRYVLALSLLEENGNSIEAIKNLEYAGFKFPQAQSLASQLRAQLEASDEDSQKSEAYLGSTLKPEANRR